MHRKEVTHSDGSYEKKSLTIWDKVKSHGKRKNWCIGRGWPLNCMTVISAWWGSDMPVQRRRKWHIPAWLAMRIDIEWAIELLYNSVRTGSQWVGDQRGQRGQRQDVVEKATTRQNGPSGLPVSWRSDELETRCSRESHYPAESWAPGPPVEQPWRTRKPQRWWPWEWGSIYCSSVRFPTPSHTQTLQINWEVHIFLKDCVARLHCVFIVLLWLCIMCLYS